MVDGNPYWIQFAAGYVGGVAGVLAGHPFDTIKIRLQTCDNLYKSGTDAFRSILRTEGPRGFFKGLIPPCIGVGAINAIIFGTEAAVMRQLGEKSTKNHMIAGTIAGGVQCVVTGPMELIKTRMQITGIGEAGVKPSIMRTSVAIFHREGVRGFSRGMGLTLARELPAFACYFGSYDYLLKLTDFKPTDSNATLKILFAGGMAGVNSWAMTYPIDQIKSKIQADASKRYLNSRDCIQKTWAEERLRGFYKGMSTSLVRAFAVNAATFVGVQKASQFIHQRQLHQERRRLKSKDMGF